MVFIAVKLGRHEQDWILAYCHPIQKNRAGILNNTSTIQSYPVLLKTSGLNIKLPRLLEWASSKCLITMFLINFCYWFISLNLFYTEKISLNLIKTQNAFLDF